VNGWLEAVECCRAVWAAGLCAVAAGSVLLTVLPRDREGTDAGLAAGAAVGTIAAAVWLVAAVCGAG